MKLSKKRIQINDEKLLAPLSTVDGVGEHLRYDPIYDQIREARREEDDNLSQGVWERELKKADFIAVEQLCANVLEFRSKDLQVAAWLSESWAILDGMEGFNRGLELIHNLASTYWGNIHPQEEDGDLEARIRLFEWMNEQFANRLLMLALTYHSLSQELPTLTLANWIAALNTETVAKRSSDYAKSITESEEKGLLTLASFKKTLQTTDARYLQKNLAFSQKAIERIHAIFELLSQKIGKQATGFKRIQTCLDDIQRICKTTLQQRSLPLEYNSDADNEEYIEEDSQTSVQNDQEDSVNTVAELMKPVGASSSRGEGVPALPDDVMNITGRREAYQALRDIGQFLQNLDPHSPAPSLIEVIVSWENKTLPLILEDLSNAPSNTQMLIRMLSSSLPKEKNSSGSAA